MKRYTFTRYVKATQIATIDAPADMHIDDVREELWCGDLQWKDMKLHDTDGVYLESVEDL